MINREKIKEIVEIFYQQPFKTFYVNSVDGEHFIKQLGVFISLGITTSPRILESVRDVINSNSNYEASIIELTSKKVSDTQYLNTISAIGDEAKQFKVDDVNLDPNNFMDRTKAMEKLEEYKKQIKEGDLESLKKYAPIISKLTDLIGKLDKSNGWELHLIQQERNDDFKIFHKFVNYKKENDLEYRLGIFVKEKAN